MTRCRHRDWLETDEDFPTGPQCEREAEWLACTPVIDTPVCEQHRCRCRKPFVDEGEIGGTASRGRVRS